MSPKIRTTHSSARLALGALAASATPAWAAWPDKTINLVVPFAPGGSTDVLARQLGRKARHWRSSKAWWCSINPVLAVPQALQYVVNCCARWRHAPDGRDRQQRHRSQPVSRSALQRRPRTFAPISEVVSAPLVLVVNSSTSSIKSVADYIAAARQKPISYGSPGSGTSMHLTGAMFQLDTGALMTHVGYRGSALALTDLLGGFLDSMFGDLLVVLPRVQAGALRALAVTSLQRHPVATGGTNRGRVRHCLHSSRLRQFHGRAFSRQRPRPVMW